MSTKKSMREFAIEFIRNNPRANPNRLAAEWYRYKNGRYAPVASRYKFGTTSAAYKTLRNLESEGLVQSDGNYHYTIVNQSV